MVKVIYFLWLVATSAQQLWSTSIITESSIKTVMIQRNPNAINLEN